MSMCRHGYRQIEYCPACAVSETQPELPLSGGSNSYYRLTLRDGSACECNDIIEALDMNFAEGNVFKAVWRRAALRKGAGKPGSTMLYESEKVEFFGKRLVEQSKE